MVAPVSLSSLTMTSASALFHSLLSYFFFSSRRRHTRWPRDWSSDVCSSDLFTLAVKYTHTCGTKYFVSREYVEVAIQRLHVHGPMTHGLSTIDQHPRSHLPSQRNHVLNRVDRAERVGDVTDGHHLYPLVQHVLQCGHIECARSVDRNRLYLRTSSLGDHLPRHSTRLNSSHVA